MKLSVVILNYNVCYFLELCLKSVQAAIANIDAEIIVVDNNSQDDSCDMVKQRFSDVKLIENKNNYGFSKGNNIGVSHAKGEYICILNPDTVVAEDTFEKLLEFSEGKHNLGAIGCKLVDGRGCFLPESKRNIPYVRAAFKKIFGDASDYYANHLSKDDIGKVNILVGAFMFLRKEVYVKVDGFDEDYFMYGEDIDLSYKLIKAGFQNYYLGNIKAVHFKGESTLRDKHYARRFYGAMQIFYKKHFKKNILFDLVVRLGIRIVYFFRGTKIEKVKSIYQYILISDKVNERLSAVLSENFNVRDVMSDFQKDTEIILDANYLSYANIIEIMHKYAGQKKWTYKILPNNSSFIVGSDDAISRGEVINF
ncbi:glycosyltransferase family 2 protein [Hyunsoonleella pacifica]|uniref:Glycosyltransferase family 2 protein n=1 Tax=Hyunsoonleella pacifica TaxID=1080224 RepID=A0A4Q9FJG3_9FLAO|nr:glycosyltransferase family 2 protein [Hyunsoonleella pacifica]TBN13817.1 glycosyltransferase family 2 protein [Hyunsoonleella pacifica]GGD25918.1 glycosyl transferase family 2 [Hyunsoonleella pacifica]